MKTLMFCTTGRTVETLNRLFETRVVFPDLDAESDIIGSDERLILDKYCFAKG